MQRLVGLGHHLQQQQAHQHPVPLRDVALDAHPARLLAAHDHVATLHQIGNVVEADRRLNHRQAKLGGDAVDHARR